MVANSVGHRKNVFLSRNKSKILTYVGGNYGLLYRVPVMRENPFCDDADVGIFNDLCGKLH